MNAIIPPVMTTNIAYQTAVSDEILVNRDGSTGVQTTSDLAVQLAATSPLDLGGFQAPLFATEAALNAAALTNKVSAWVFGDPDADKNGVWSWNGTEWVWTLPLPYSISVLHNAGAGTPNAIQATSKVPLVEGLIAVIPIVATTIASPLTVTINSNRTFTVKTMTGNDIVAGGLIEGMMVLALVQNDTLRLLSDEVSAAILAAAEAARVAAQIAQEAAETAKAEAEAAAASNVDKVFVSIAQAMAANISASAKRIQTQFRAPNWLDKTTLVGDAPYRRVSFSELTGYPASAYFRSQDRFMLDGTTDAVNGGYWVLDDNRPDPFQFGARVGPITENSFNFNSGPALEQWVWFVNNVTGYGEVLPGGYRCDRTLYIDSGVHIECLGSTSCIELPWFSAEALEIEEGVTFIMTGNGPKLETLDFCSSLEFGGLYRSNPLRTHSNAFDGVFAATDFTNSDAVGATRASLRPFSAAVVIGKDGSSGKTRLSGLRVIPECNDGVDGPLAGYLQIGALSYIPWAQWDVGIYVLNGYTTHITDCQAGGFWGLKGVLQTSVRFGNLTGGGRGEQCLWERCWIQGGVAVRNGDFYPVTTKAANTITIPWSKGHRFAPTGTIFTNVGAFTYTLLTYSSSGEGTLTFTVTGSTSSVIIGGIDASFVYMTNNNGTTQTKFSDCNIRDFWHTTDVEKPSASFGAQAGRYSATIELCGYPVRGITFENNTIYDRQPLSILQQGARDIRFMTSGTWEEKDYRATIDGAYNPSGASQGLVICGPDNAHADSYNALMRGHIDLESYPWSGRMNLSGRGLATGAVAGRRYSAYGDWFNPFRFTWSGRPSGDQDIMYDARLPERRIISAGAVTAYGRHFQIDTEGSAATDDLTNILPYVMGLNEILFQTFSSSRDVLIKHMAGGDYQIYCKTGADTWLYSPITPVMFVLLGKVWYQI